MLLVRCAYCQGTGKQLCSCRAERNGGEEIERVPVVLSLALAEETSKAEGTTEQMVLSSPRSTEGDPQCALCQDRGFITCPGCCGSGFVEMPALA